jgi:hypothetical protein
MKLSMTLPHSPDTANLALWSKSLILAAGRRLDAKQIAERMGAPAAVIKAIAAPMDRSDMEMFADSNHILTSFAATVRNISAFFWLIQNGAFRAPFNQRISYFTGLPSGKLRGEGEVISVKRATGDKVFLQPKMVAGISVFTKEMITSVSGQGEAFLTTELKRAIVPTLDAGMFSLITDGSTPTMASSGPAPTGAIADIRWLLSQVNPKAESRLVWVMSPDVGQYASTLYEAGWVFERMGPTGGEICNTPAIVSDGLDPGTFGLIDATGIAADSLGVDLTVSTQSSLQLDDSPDSPVTSSTNVISLWQQNLVALMPQVMFDVERMRANAFAKVTGVNWGAGADSPA